MVCRNVHFVKSHLSIVGSLWMGSAALLLAHNRLTDAAWKYYVQGRHELVIMQMGLCPICFP